MKSFLLFGAASVAAVVCACSTSNTISEHNNTTFSKADSLTDAYLVLSDSVLQSWNRVVGNEMDKSRTLQEIIQDLDNASMLTDDLRESFQVRMEQLEKIRFTQESIADPQIVVDYDIAFKAIVDDLSKLAKTDENQMFMYLERSSVLNRLSYDSLAKSFNAFVQKNRQILKDVGSNNELETKPLFVNVK
jgi:hypothetical protein